MKFFIKKSIYLTIMDSLFNNNVELPKEKNHFSLDEFMFGERKMIKKSLNTICDEIIEKANDWGKKIPVKKETSDGRVITYWISPEDLNQGKMRGAQNLFDESELNQGPESKDSYFSNIDSEMEEYKIKPLVEKMEKDDPKLARRISEKYEFYKWGRDTKELDVELDEKTLEFMEHVKKQPEYKEEHYQDFLKETDSLCKKLNNRKLSMARLKLKSAVTYKGKSGKITGFTKRGYPIVTTNDGKENKCFVDEIVNMDELIEKFGKAV